MKAVEAMLMGSRRDCARLITQVENEHACAKEILSEIYPHTGSAHVVGITGPPGGGKSTLTTRLAEAFRAQDKRVGIIAVDPTSPFTGGAILGDRIRMKSLYEDQGVFIRSMGTRGHLGGLSKTTAGVIQILDAFGCDVIFVETVGVGQSEVEIVQNADTVLMVLVPGLGDDIQAIKAGVMEIGDLFIINKYDLDGAVRAKTEIEMMLATDQRRKVIPLVYPVTASMAGSNRAEGIESVVEGIIKHRRDQIENGQWETRRKEQARNEILYFMRGELEVMLKKELDQWKLNRVYQRNQSPRERGEEILRSWIKEGKHGK
ncbi:methylmalonyl Co-A mutase-associated GTPase MeaB [Gottschalkiaceae bacterium SANA]|nr:methylmalonyl Co-A mutase-associated GTPase MeaB [Gottschalkiaceae bacterium SANA]